MSNLIGIDQLQGVITQEDNDNFVMTRNGITYKTSRKTGMPVLQSALISVTSANHGINGTPITVVPAAGGFNVIMPIQVIGSNEYSGSAFNFGGADLRLAYAAAPTVALVTIANAWAQNAANLIRQFISLNNVTAIANSGLVLTCNNNGSGSPAGALRLRVVYAIMPVK